MTDEADNFSKKKSIWTTLIRTIISLVLVIVLFANIDLVIFRQAFQKFSAIFLIGLPLAFGLNILFSALRWQALLQSLDVKEKLYRLFLIYFISFFWGNFLPTTIGGDGYRFLKMRSRHPGKDSEILSSLFLDRAYGFAILLVLHIVTTLYFLKEIRFNLILFWIEISIIVGGVLLFVLWQKRRVLNRFKLFQVKLIENVFAKIRKILALSKKQTWRTILFASLMSFVFVVVSSWAWEICYKAAGVRVNSLFVLYASTLSSILGVLPISFNGLGLVELSQTIAMGTQGISAETVLVAAFSARVMGLLISALGGGVHLVESLLSTIYNIDR